MGFLCLDIYFEKFPNQIYLTVVRFFKLTISSQHLQIDTTVIDTQMIRQEEYADDFEAGRMR